MRYAWHRPIEILLVEDDAASCYLMKAGLRGSKVNHHVSSVNNGEEAIEFLKQHGGYAQAPRPDLVFLDLHLPRKDGREVLAAIKTDLELRRIPVIVLTSSSDQDDVNTVYDLHANCYLTKPSDADELSEQIRAIEEFWFEMVLWPTAAPVALSQVTKTS
jgi:two-component system, chemotaxis family, response regulator Rcp1